MVCALQNVLNGVSYNILKYICAVLFAAAINRKKKEHLQIICASTSQMTIQ